MSPPGYVLGISSIVKTIETRDIIICIAMEAIVSPAPQFLKSGRLGLEAENFPLGLGNWGMPILPH